MCLFLPVWVHLLCFPGAGVLRAGGKSLFSSRVSVEAEQKSIIFTKTFSYKFSLSGFLNILHEYYMFKLNTVLTVSEVPSLISFYKIKSRSKYLYMNWPVAFKKCAVLVVKIWIKKWLETGNPLKTREMLPRHCSTHILHDSKVKTTKRSVSIEINHFSLRGCIEICLHSPNRHAY